MLLFSLAFLEAASAVPARAAAETAQAAASARTAAGPAAETPLSRAVHNKKGAAARAAPSSRWKHWISVWGFG